MSKSVFLLIVLSVAISGCAKRGAPSPEEINSAYYGPRPTNYEKQIKNWYSKTLFDQYSAHFEIGSPQKGWGGRTGGLVVERNIMYFWVVPVRINAKNRLGGYTGWQTSHCSFQNGTLHSCN